VTRAAIAFAQNRSLEPIASFPSAACVTIGRGDGERRIQGSDTSSFRILLGPASGDRSTKRNLFTIIPPRVTVGPLSKRGRRMSKRLTTVYPSLSALVSVERLLAEAGKAIDDQTRTLLHTEVPEILGAVGGAGAGMATGATILSAGAASGTAGAAALTSGLATAGSFLGGGMMAGIVVVAAPAVIFSVSGYWLLSKRNRRKLGLAKEAKLQEAIRKRDAMLRELQAKNRTNKERVDYLARLVTQLESVIENLEADLRVAKPA
jgi:hypothetical protein